METRNRSAANIKLEQSDFSLDQDPLEEADGSSQCEENTLSTIQSSCDEGLCDGQSTITESGDAGQTIHEGYNFETTSPLKRSGDNEKELDVSVSPPKQLKVTEQTAESSVSSEIGNQFDENTNDDDCDKEAAAEEIVQKLCKNGKVLTLTEGEKYFKVIVYEDSEENQEDPDDPATGPADESNRSQQNLIQKIVDGDFDDDGSQSDHSESQHVLTERTNTLVNIPTGVTQTDTNSQNVSVMPQAVADSAQWYSDVCSPPGYSHTSPAAAIQSNFAQTMSQFAPSFLTCNLQESHEQNIPYSNDENIPQFIKPAGPHTAGNQKLFCTPHPKNGQYMFYYTDQEGNTTRSDFIPFNTSTPSGRSRQRSANKSKTMVTPHSVTLNSSGEENRSPPDHFPNTTPMVADKKTRTRTRLDPDVEIMGEEGTLREQHNQKERRRRARIKEACDLMRQLVPGMSDKTDKATVFEFGARYIHFLKSFIGTEHDKDFLMKYSPY